MTTESGTGYLKKAAMGRIRAGYHVKELADDLIIQTANMKDEIIAEIRQEQRLEHAESSALQAKKKAKAGTAE